MRSNFTVFESQISQLENVKSEAENTWKIASLVLSLQDHGNYSPIAMSTNTMK